MSDSLQLCISDLRHSAIVDDALNMLSCVLAVCNRLDVLVTHAGAAAEPVCATCNGQGLVDARCADDPLGSFPCPDCPTSALTSAPAEPERKGGDPTEPRDDSDREYTKPIGYQPAYELGRLHSGHDANLRSAKFGPSPLDGDVPVYLNAPSEPKSSGLPHGALETLRTVVATLREYGRFDDEEGEPTNALEDLRDWLTNTPLAPAETPPAAAPAAEVVAMTDEQIMEIGHRHFKPNPDLTESAKAAFVASVRECIALVAPGAAIDAREQDEADARRYRWLREEAQYFPHGAAPSVVLCDESDFFQRGERGSDHGFIYGKKLDECIDHAMRSSLASRPEAPAAAGGAQAVEPMFFASAGQAHALRDRPDDNEGGVYLPLRKTAAGNFTMPLYAATPAPEDGEFHVIGYVVGFDTEIQDKQVPGAMPVYARAALKAAQPVERGEGRE